MTSFAPAFKRVKPGLGTLVELTVRGAEAERAVAATEAAFAEARRLESLLSAFEPGGELSALNSEAARAEAIPLSPELGEVLALGSAIERESNGAFRLMPACPHDAGECYALEADSAAAHAARRRSGCVFDLGGIAKGWIVDRVFEGLIASLGEGIGVVVSAGGDLRCSGEEDVELRVPSRADERRYALRITGAAVATSSVLGTRMAVGTASARFAARDVRPTVRAGADSDTDAVAGAVASASVVAARCALADALTKIALFGAPASLTGRGDVFVLHLFDADGAPLAGKPA